MVKKPLRISFDILYGSIEEDGRDIYLSLMLFNEKYE